MKRSNIALSPPLANFEPSLFPSFSPSLFPFIPFIDHPRSIVSGEGMPVRGIVCVHA